MIFPFAFDVQTILCLHNVQSHSTCLIDCQITFCIRIIEKCKKTLSGYNRKSMPKLEVYRVISAKVIEILKL